MSEKIPSVSFWDSLFYNLAYGLPAYLVGVFTRNRFWYTLVAKLHPDPLGVRFIGHLRRKYDSDYLYLSAMGSKTLMVLHVDGIRRVLDRSPDVYAEPPVKRRGMSHWQPHSLTISRGDPWRDRRRFNEAVLASQAPRHPYAEPFLTAVREEVAAMQAQAGQQQTWRDFKRLFEHICLRVVFGEKTEDRSVPMALRRMMREANRLFALRRSRHFDGLYGGIRSALKYPRDESLVALCPQAPASAQTRVENQVPHWMFAIQDTLASNTVRALALILSYPHAERRVRDEIAEGGSGTGLEKLRYLEACVQEAMRLWPSTPSLVRQTVVADALGGAIVSPNTQVLIPNGFNHRDSTRDPHADRFSPERWLEGGTEDYRFNHFSHGAQGCPGKDLALLIAKAVLAELLRGHRYTLRKPTLHTDSGLPYMYNHFRAVFTAVPQRRSELAGQEPAQKPGDQETASA